MRQVWLFSQTRWVGLFFFFFCFFPHFIVLAFYLRNIWIIIYHPSVALVFIYFQSRYRLFWGESACSVLHFNEDGENWAELCFPSVLGYFCYINSANLFFFLCTNQDFPRCDLLIIMGTSLQVQPFAGLVGRYCTFTTPLVNDTAAVITTASDGYSPTSCLTLKTTLNINDFN